MTLNRARHVSRVVTNSTNINLDCCQLPLTEGGMEQQQTYESGLLLLHPEDNPRAAPGLAQPLSREEGHRNVSAELY